MHQIENGLLRVKAREYGAELTSLYDLRSKTERLWQADEAIWGWHAPVLFPVVGRCLNDEIRINQRTFKMEKHGFARRSTFRLLELSDSKMVFSLTSDKDTLLSYPYLFEFLISYRLEAHCLLVSYEVVNKDDQDIYFSLGGHPAFAAPLYNDENYEDYYLEFEQTENVFRHKLNQDGFFTGEKDLVLNQERTINLKKDIFKNDALIFEGLKSNSVTLKSKKHPHYVKMNFDGFPFLGIWAKENAPYVCIEPWKGCADTKNRPVDISNKEGIVLLETGKTFCITYKIEIG
ncbi:MAG: aldose 1-epimerase family protein [Bacteroidetes bacterium]|nr:aldose 1-epimerase family protein [Bacteroidota bacterium]